MAVSFHCYLFCSHCIAVLSVLSIYIYTHTVHGHRLVFCLHLHNLIHVLYAYNIIHTFFCVNHYCTCAFVTHSCVWIVAGLGLCVLYSFSSLTLDALYLPCITLHAHPTLILVLYSNYYPLMPLLIPAYVRMIQCLCWTQHMYLILEWISLSHIYVALVQHAYEGREGGGGKGTFTLGPQFVSPPKAICNTIITHFVFAPEANSYTYSCILPLVTYVDRIYILHVFFHSLLKWQDTYWTCQCSWKWQLKKWLKEHL